MSNDLLLDENGNPITVTYSNNTGPGFKQPQFNEVVKEIERAMSERMALSFKEIKNKMAFDPYDMKIRIDPYLSPGYRDQYGSYGSARDLQMLQQQTVQQQQVIDQMTKKLKEQDAVLQALAAPPFQRGVVVEFGANGPDGKPATVLISVDGRVLEVAATPGVVMEIGSRVRLNAKTMAIVSAVEEKAKTPNGVIVPVTAVNDDGTIEIEWNASTKVVTAKGQTEKGDRVVVNDAMTMVLKNLGKQRDTFKADVEKIATTWEDIGGQHQAKMEMREAIETPIQHADIFRAYGKKPVKGVLLYGPPGCGKTLLAKAAATSLAKLHGKSASTGFIYVKGPEILNRYVGQSEETVRELFARARDHHQKEGYPAVLFIDEADAILGARDGNNTMITGMEKTIVPMFLAEMDGLDEHGPLVLLATNRSDCLDPAIVRDGRVDRKIEVTRPTEADSVEIFRMYLRGKPVADAGIDYEQVFAAKLFASPLLRLRVCGALIAGLVEQAVSQAMRRDIAAGLSAPTGLTTADVDASIKAVEAQNLKVR